MTLANLTEFFMWCTLINGSLLLLWSVFYLLCPRQVYRMQKPWSPWTEDEFQRVFYCFIGLFKILFIVFSLVPYLALLIIS